MYTVQKHCQVTQLILLNHMGLMGAHEGTDQLYLRYSYDTHMHKAIDCDMLADAEQSTQA